MSKSPQKRLALYLAHPISTTGEAIDSARIASNILKLTNEQNEQKFEVYAPALNKEINDKSNNPTPLDIYDQDMLQLDKADVVVVNYTGAAALGTLLELATLGAYHQINKNLWDKVMASEQYRNLLHLPENGDWEEGVWDGINLVLEVLGSSLPKVFVYTSNQRTIQPQLFNPTLQEQYDPERHGNSLKGFIPSGSENHMIIGMISRHLTWCESEEEVMEKLKQL